MIYAFAIIVNTLKGADNKAPFVFTHPMLSRI